MRRLPNSPRKGAAISIELDGETLPAIEGEPVACSLLAAGEDVFARSVKYHRPRGPSCFAGACSNCLMRVDGIPNLFTCQVPARPGMRLERQNAFPSAKLDVFASIDWLFPKGLDHHEMLAGVPIAENVMAKVARHLAGLGVLPAKAPAERPAVVPQHTEVCVVGGGAAGLAASTELSNAGIPHWLLEQDRQLGGRCALEDPSIALSWRAGPHASVQLETRAVGLYIDEGGKFLLATQGSRLLKVYATRFLLTSGGHASLLPFENNDLPGVITAQAAARLLTLEGLAPGEAPAIVGDAVYVQRMAALFERSGIKPAVTLEGGAVLRAHGPTRVRAISWSAPDGKTHRTSCDAIIVALPPTASYELARQGGARVAFSQEHSGFVVEASSNGATHAPDIFVAGEVTGPKSPEQVREQAVLAARALATNRVQP